MRFLIKFLVLISILGIVFVYVLSSYNIVTVEGDEKGLVLILKDGDVLQIKFIHSVELVDYIEVYEVRDGYLILKCAKTESLGWGIPYDGNFSFEDGYLTYRYNKSFKEIYISTSEINDYTLTVDGKSIKLGEFGKTVRLGVDDLCQSIFQSLRGSSHTRGV